MPRSGHSSRHAASEERVHQTVNKSTPYGVPVIALYSPLAADTLAAYNLPVIFVELPLFARYVAFSDDELRELQEALVNDPRAGDLIPGGQGLRKLRAALGGRGKRGGARVIYYWWAPRDRCYLVFAYAKSEADNLSPVQLRALARAMQEVLRDDG